MASSVHNGEIKDLRPSPHLPVEGIAQLFRTSNFTGPCYHAFLLFRTRLVVTVPLFIPGFILFSQPILGLMDLPDWRRKILFISPTV